MSQAPNDGGPFCSAPFDCQFAFDQKHDAQQMGMSLRDYFAAKAMAAILTHRDAFEDSGESDVARMAYNQADAMLAVRAGDTT